MFSLINKFYLSFFLVSFLGLDIFLYFCTFVSCNVVVSCDLPK